MLPSPEVLEKRYLLMESCVMTESHSINHLINNNIWQVIAKTKFRKIANERRGPSFIPEL